MNISDLCLQLTREQKELKDNVEIVGSMLSRQRQLRSSIKNIESQIGALTPKTLEITDHAILRFAERHHGLNVSSLVEEMRRKIGRTETTFDAKINGFVIEDGIVKTYLGGLQLKPQRTNVGKL